MTREVDINGVKFEYDAEPTDGVSLSDGKAWWGTHVKYRRVTARKWQRFNVIDVHSWDTDAITRALAFQVSR